MALAEVEIFGCSQGTGPGTLLSQTISFNPIFDKLTTDNPFPLNATASSGLPVFFELVSGPAFLQNGNIVTLTGNEGTVIIKAIQSGNSQYIAAPEVTQSFEVTLPPTTGGCGNTTNIALGSSTSQSGTCLLYTSPSPRDKRQSRMPSSA